MEDNLKTKEIFDSAVSIVRNLPKEGQIKPSDDLKLKFYAYFKQATHGPNDTPKPRFYQIVEAYKWDAWSRLGNMTKEEAMLNYIKELKQVMDSIPPSESGPEETRHFESVLGKKFYDYWFSQWRQIDYMRARSSSESRLDKELIQKSDILSSHEIRSNSSSNSSVSLLDETRTGGDGYKTPTSSTFKEFQTGEMSDQFALAVIRLQRGLEETISRLDAVEGDLRQAQINLRSIETRTLVKRPIDQLHKTNHSPNILSVLRNIKTVHWFYLSYPFLVYFIMRLLRRKHRAPTQSS